MYSRKRSDAGLSSDEWNGAETGRDSARLAAFFLGRDARSFDCTLVTGDHDLRRGVEIDRFDYLALRRRGTYRAHILVRQTEDCRHRT